MEAIRPQKTNKASEEEEHEKADCSHFRAPAHRKKFSYEFTKKHRVTQGALVMLASLGAGAIVMLTKSRNHWLYIDYREQNVPKDGLLRLDQKVYKKVLDALKVHAGKEVLMLG